MQDALSRRDQILQALAHMLETQLGEKITTARLAAEVGVSEAALYRHFPSKTKMFEGLVVFMEETIFSRVKLILQEENNVVERCQSIVQLLLAFAERNPGMCRILIGDALAGDLVRLKSRVVQLFDRLETQLKQVIREAELREGMRPFISQSIAANLILLFAEGKINQFVRSEFKRKPSDDFETQWLCLSRSIFRVESG